MKNFAITGIAGYIAPRHLGAIKETGNNLIAALDPHDSVGILDRYFSDVSFFTEFERFDRFIEKQRRQGDKFRMHYLSICSPNHLHDAQIRYALRAGAHAICEKPLVLNPWNLDALETLEKETGKNVYTILQLRVHPALIKLKEKIDTLKTNTKHNIELTYITSRGPWYHYSWKGDEKKSGGVATNIGVHFFDMLMWIFGNEIISELHFKSESRMSGFLELDKANVKWYLSIDKNDLPESVALKGQSTYRSIKIDDEEIEFTDGFTDLHTVIYKNILAENGFGPADARAAIEAVYRIRNARLTENRDTVHPYLEKIIREL